MLLNKKECSKKLWRCLLNQYEYCQKQFLIIMCFFTWLWKKQVCLF